MKKQQLSGLWMILVLVSFMACTPKAPQTVTDPLQSWNETAIKQSILSYLNDSITKIPVSDRIAVFDMDGTIACETPLWFEMYAAVDGLNQQSATDPELLKFPEYEYAQKLAVNPADTSVMNHWATPINYIDSMVWKAYVGVDHEAYVDSARTYLQHTSDPKFGMPLADLFYKPMLELLQLLQDKEFTIYVVSGSMQGVIWSVCPQTIGFDREHLIGTRQILVPVYNPDVRKTEFIIQKGIFPPKDDKDGKSLNIYSHIGKVPVFAFGNTTGDFGMFRLTSTSCYPHAEYLLNHNDSIREYFYPPYHGAPDTTWQKTMAENHWNQVDMLTEFKNVWMDE